MRPMNLSEGFAGVRRLLWMSCRCCWWQLYLTWHADGANNGGAEKGLTPSTTTPYTTPDLATPLARLNATALSNAQCSSLLLLIVWADLLWRCVGQPCMQCSSAGMALELNLVEFCAQQLLYSGAATSHTSRQAGRQVEKADERVGNVAVQHTPRRWAISFASVQLGS